MSSSSERNQSRFQTLFLAVLLLAVTVSIYYQVGDYELLTWDDHANLTQNVHLYPPTWENLAVLWQKPYAQLYIPLTYSFWMVEANLAHQPEQPDGHVRYDAAIFHYGNLLLHLVSVLAVYGILLRLVRHNVGAFLGALLFSLHPLQAESVSWVSETKGLLAAVFSFAAIWLYLASTDEWSIKEIEPEQPSSVPPPWRRAVYYVLGTLAFVLALLSKPTAVAVVPMIVVIDIGLLRRRARQVAGSTGLWFVLAVAAAGITIAVQGDSASSVEVPLWARPFVAGDALSNYVFKLGAPLNLGPDYAQTPQFVMEHWWCYLTWIFPLAIILWLARLEDRRVWLSAVGIFIAGLLPVLGIVTFEYQKISTVADRYVYLAMLGPALAAAYLVRISPTRAALAVGAVLAALLGYLSFVQSGHWTNDYELFSYNLSVTPHSTVSHVKLGNMLFAAAHASDDKDRRIEYLEAARDHFRVATKLDPKDHRALYNLGSTLLLLNEPKDAAECYRQVVDLRPNMADAHFSLGVALDMMGEHAEARSEYQETLRLDPDHAGASQNLERFKQVLEPLP